MNILAPISVGELFDKITILEIKLEQFTDETKLIHVKNELSQLKSLTTHNDIDITEEILELKRINKIIWDNEDLARTYGNGKDYDHNFIVIASKTYEANADRARIKRVINNKCNSNIIEIKSYTNEGY